MEIKGHRTENKKRLMIKYTPETKSSGVDFSFAAKNSKTCHALPEAL
jgi:hypothetical protein